MLPYLCTYLYFAEKESATTNQVSPKLLVYPLGIMGGVSGALLVALAASVCIIVVLLRKGKYRPYSYCVMDDVIVSIAILITELYGQLSSKRVVLCITKAVKRSSLVFGNNIMFTYQVCC